MTPIGPIDTIEFNLSVLVSSLFACLARFASWRIQSERSNQQWLKEEQRARSA